jgi:hypothetical protein
MKKFVCAMSFVALAMVGCKKEGGEAAPATAEAKKEMAAAPAEKPATAAPSGGEIGVAECDDYVSKMKACLDKMPAEAKAASQSAFDQSINAWKQAAGTEAGKQGLATACKAALDAIAQNPMCK